MKAHLLFLLSIFLWPCHVLPALTNAIDPERLAYNLRTTVEAYEKVGRKNPKWDADSKGCLTAFARIRSTTNGAIGEFRNELRTILPRLAEATCDDPMIRYLYLRYVFTDAHSAGENAAAMGELATTIQKSDYPDIRKFYATTWAGRLLQEAKASRAPIDMLLEKAARRTEKVRADYVGFSIPDLFVVGYGLDFAERYRNLPFIAVLKNPDAAQLELPTASV